MLCVLVIFVAAHIGFSYGQWSIKVQQTLPETTVAFVVFDIVVVVVQTGVVNPFI